ncbi:MAG: hypothetical protein ACPGAF_09335 [Pseudohongiellaceae bacterium]
MNRLVFPCAAVALKFTAWLIFSVSLSASVWGQSGGAHVGFEEDQAAAKAAQIRAEKLARQQAEKEARLQELAGELARKPLLNCRASKEFMINRSLKLTMTWRVSIWNWKIMGALPGRSAKHCR